MVMEAVGRTERLVDMPQRCRGALVRFQQVT